MHEDLTLRKLGEALSTGDRFRWWTEPGAILLSVLILSALILFLRAYVPVPNWLVAAAVICFLGAPLLYVILGGLQIAREARKGHLVALSEMDTSRDRLWSVLDELHTYDARERSRLLTQVEVQLALVDRRMEMLGGRFGSLGVLPTLAAVLIAVSSGPSPSGYPLWAILAVALLAGLYLGWLIALRNRDFLYRIFLILKEVQPLSRG